ncbi:hypothetical protein FRX31_005872 [Thalictrum thalictroides]|uniref:F-box protein n=1 Tax=Thalictrum thalictroides TaxID=46969 RepID=A0A7J6X856_THATH|nr:hypothetical protein FRX31_005872 [Thalictrum thalictroides]
MEESDLFKMFTLKKHPTTGVSSSSSFTNISDLHEDTLVEIICKLPIKHMVSCKSVSKLWHKLIANVCIPRIKSCSVFGLLYSTSPVSFLDNNVTNKRGPWSFSCINASDHINNTSLVESCLGGILPFRPAPYDFLDCCDGLLLFFNPSSMQYYVCNPSTQQYVTIPNSPQENIPQIAFLSCDQNYRVVYICGLPLTMNIYSLTSREWEVFTLDIEPSIAEAPMSIRYISFEGSFYRLSVAGYLVKFNVNQKGVQTFELPKIVVRDVPIGCLGVSQGRLHYAWDDQVSQMMVWVLDESGHPEQWVLKHNICLQFFEKHPLRTNLHERLCLSVHAFHPTSDVLFVGNSSGILSYDTNTRRLETIFTLGSDRLIYSPEYAVYVFSVNLTPLGA